LAAPFLDAAAFFGAAFALVAGLVAFFVTMVRVLLLTMNLRFPNSLF
jgi:hypothetical protein